MQIVWFPPGSVSYVRHIRRLSALKYLDRAVEIDDLAGVCDFVMDCEIRTAPHSDQPCMSQSCSYGLDRYDRSVLS